MNKEKFKKYLYILLAVVAFSLLLVYNSQNKNQTFKGAGKYISGSHGNSIKNSDVDATPTILRWLNPFD